MDYSDIQAYDDEFGGEYHLKAQEVFWAKVERHESGCWRWAAFTGAYGYGSVRLSDPSDLATGEVQRNVQAHRMAYELAYGPIPRGLEIDHTCDRRNCVNPSHLRAVTHERNMARTRRKPRRARPLPVPQATRLRLVLGAPCPNGHMLTEETARVYRHTRGSKYLVCRPCAAEYHRAHRERMKAANPYVLT